ncbi:unnamed protein product [Paramecium pentaurelia]|uniref:Protein kinase domain-containing protein n=1 Tax=Paramecium pentaurelia TaxID=43138 RepID=A0A8S1SGQ0_9CILI|nr:unnamed protein product [Paramecium pentaurelia]
MSKKTVGQKYEYELQNRLGQGAFAEVYKGKNKVTGEIVAIKVIKRSLLAKYGDDILKQIHQEVSILQSLMLSMRKTLCPFINKIYECLETSNNIYIVLEFCNQGTLLDKIKKTRKLPEDEAIFVFFQLVQALDFLCDNNIAHRDIKPENVFIKDGVYKLGDFGFAGQKSLYNTHLGTYPYMAPEFFNSNQYDGNQVDIWALGLLFHEILFGEIYFIGNSQYEVSQKILSKQYTLGSQHQCCKEIRDLLPRMIEKDKSKRITAKQILELPIFQKYKKDNRYLEIEEKERQFWQQFLKSENSQTEEDIKKAQKEEEERQRKEEVEKQRLALEKLQREENQKRERINQQILKIIDIINDMRNGIMIIIKLCEFLQNNFSEVCRYDIFYILKQGYQQQHILKEKLDRADILTKQDHVDFEGIDLDVWDYFYQDQNVQCLIIDIEHDRNQVRKSYISQFNYLNNWTSSKYNNYLLEFQSIGDLDITGGIPLELYLNQLASTITFLKNEESKQSDNGIKLLLKKAIIWIFVVAYYKELISGNKVNISKFLRSIDSDEPEEMKKCLYSQ